jgi:2-oxoglutarate dehydrogenase E2 component (dihydrolipoamide succinyltransferase)
MIPYRVLVGSRLLRSRRPPQLRYPVLFYQLRSYADKIVKVPEMAESISEGTLKQWQKQIGDFVEQDEEIATIETDKVSVYITLLDTNYLLRFYRSIFLSMLLQLELSKNFSQTRKTL